MKNRKIAFFSMAGLLALSACVQPESRSAETLRRQTAGPLAVDGDRGGKSNCRTSDGDAHFARIGEGAEALFQILQTDPDDLRTVRERTDRLLELQREYAANFVADCAAAGMTSENTALRIEKLEALARETDAAVIRALAAQLWDLFNPNLKLRDEAGGDASRANPFTEGV